MLTQIEEKLYICPGETHPISRSVHLSRLAAFFPACRECPFRSETGQIPARTVERLQQTEHRVVRASLITDEGVRGVYLNEFNRQKAEQYAAAFAALLWEESPLIGKEKPTPADKETTRSLPKRHSIVVGYDERPSSPDIVTGVATALRRMGCHVIDIGRSTTPCFRFTVDHLQATGGVFVTGSGCQQSWTGMEFVTKNAIPVSSNSEQPDNARQPSSEFRPPSSSFSLNRVEARMKQSISRQTRSSGDQRHFQGLIPYRAGLWKHFQNLEPLTIVFGTTSQLIQQTLEPIFETLPCELVMVDLPDRLRDLSDPEDADVVRLSDAVRDQQADLGVLIDDDGQRVAFLDEAGTLVPAESVTRILAESLLAENAGETIVVENASLDEAYPAIHLADGASADGGTTRQAMFQAMREQEAIFGGGNSGRYWFREAYPTCDAILAFAKILELLSQSKAPFSTL